MKNLAICVHVHSRSDFPDIAKAPIDQAASLAWTIVVALCIWTKTDEPNENQSRFTLLVALS